MIDRLEKLVGKTKVVDEEEDVTLSTCSCANGSLVVDFHL